MVSTVFKYTIQTAISLTLFILGLLLLVVWSILYANRLANNITPEWWIWLLLGFGLAFLIIGLVWLIIVQYLLSSKAYEIIDRQESEELLLEEDRTKSTKRITR